jgi:4,5-DOPA dioxygenase extradiol
MPEPLPTLFLYHGAPDLVIDRDQPAHRFLAGLAATLPRPTAIVVLSAHWETPDPAVEIGERPATIHDFGGFADELYRIRYPAPGDPVLAGRILDLLRDWGPAGVQRGFDHGVWVPLAIAWPAADIPVVPVSLLRDGSMGDHLRLGAALAPLRHEGVLVIGSGSATHNLRELGHGAPPPWVTGFDDWLAQRVEAGDADALVRYRTQAPDARRNHPSEEHYAPLLAALGAAGPGAQGRVLHRSTTYGVLSMAAYVFG